MKKSFGVWKINLVIEKKKLCLVLQKIMVNTFAVARETENIFGSIFMNYSGNVMKNAVNMRGSGFIFDYIDKTYNHSNRISFYWVKVKVMLDLKIAPKM